MYFKVTFRQNVSSVCTFFFIDSCKIKVDGINHFDFCSSSQKGVHFEINKTFLGDLKKWFLTYGFFFFKL